MATLADLATLIRSKNAGPFWLTLDIMFDDADSFTRVVRAGVVNAPAVARCYGLDVSQVRVMVVANAQAIKVSFPRLISAGAPGDGDCLGGQQYAPLLDIPVP